MNLVSVFSYPPIPETRNKGIYGFRRIVFLYYEGEGAERPFLPLRRNEGVVPERSILHGNDRNRFPCTPRGATEKVFRKLRNKGDFKDND